LKSRDSLITRLQTDSTFTPGDSSYRRAYYQRIYDLCKARFMEGASEDEIGEKVGPLYFGKEVARVKGDSIGVFKAQEEIDRYEDISRSNRQYEHHSININQMSARMLNNGIYDIINMNSFNFIRASFDDLFFRFPTQAELTTAYTIIDDNKTGFLVGGSASNKAEYCKMLTESREFYEGMIKWSYLSLLARDPTTQEVYNLFQNFYKTDNLQEVQKSIIRTDEYANF
ncbi:MAG: hypothetical protein H7321_03110, partial [Bacteroidia bacterium]|nr:hypothetical protein [Bacteroidia bacterium]